LRRGGGDGAANLARNGAANGLADDSLLGDHRLALDDAGLFHPLGHIHAAAAHHGAAASACAEFRQGHANRHDVPLFHRWRTLPTGDVSSYRAFNGAKVQNKILSSTFLTSVNLVLAVYYRSREMRGWLMCVDGTVLGGVG
jgi:hypothetical protein